MNRELLRRAGRARVLLICAVSLGVLGAVAMVVQLTLLSEVVDRAFLGDEGLGGLWRPLLLLLGASVLRSGLLWLREVVALRGAVRAKAEIRDRLFAHLLRLGPSYSGGERTGELVTTAVEGVERLEAYFARYLPQVALSTLVPLLIAAYVLTLDLLSGIVLLATAPAIPVLMVLIGKHAEEHTRLQWDILSRMGAHFLDVLRGLPTLKAFGRAGAERGRVARISDEFGRRTLEVLRVAFVSGLALEFIATVSVALVAVLLAVRLLYAGLPFEIAFPVLLLAPEFYRPLRELGVSRHAGMEGKAAAGRIGEILDTPVTVRETDGPHQEPDGRITVELADVSFTYPGSARPALSGVGLALPAGTRTALVGPSGAGKSTLVDLLLRFADPQGGRILANGVPIDGLAAEDWREKVALVPQSPHLFYGSVLENLRLARPDASREEAERAAKLAGAHEFVRRMARGYDTHVGERGVRLSEGEAQRLAIARAFLKDAPVLVMDEPASSLDPESERLVQDALERLARDRTVLVSAHRLGTARGADRVVALEEGRVAEVGTHAELIASGGPYGRLVGAAARGDAGERGQPRGSGPRPDARDGRWREDGRRDPTGRGDDPEERGKGRARGRARILPRLLSFLAPYRWRITLAVLLGAWTMGANVGVLAVSGYLISAAALHPPLGELILAAVLVQVFGGSRAFSRYAERLTSHDATFGLLAGLRAWLYERLEPLSPARLTRRRGGDLLARMVDDVEELQNVYLGAISPAVVAAAVSALACAILYAFAPPLAFAVLIFLALAGAGMPLAVGILERGLGRRQVRLRAALNSELAEWLWGMRDLLAFGRARERQRRVSDLGREVGEIQGRVALATGLREALHELMAGLAMWTVLFLSIPLVEEGRIGGVYLALLALVTLGSFEAVRPLGEALQSLGRSLAAGERLFEIADSKPAVADPVNPLAAPAGHELRLDRVTFRYGEDEAPVLEDVSFALAPGKRVAVVGPSGSGKSTLASLLLRFWDPTDGEVRLDGRDLRLYAQEDARSAVSLAAQDAHLFDTTLRENLLLARPGATKAEIEAVLEHAQLDAFVGGLPRGLETRVGELGSRLSGGERQRLAVARALLKDAPILVLDEPTANLDPDTERRMMDAIHGSARGRALILITHRLVGMERMDEILVLDRGRIVERGTHDRLIEADGLYRKLVEVQDRMLATTP